MIPTEDEKLLRECQMALERGDNFRALTAADESLIRDPDGDAAMFAAGTALLRADQKGLALMMLNAARSAMAKSMRPGFNEDRHKMGVIWNNIAYCVQQHHPEMAYKALLKAIEYGYDGLSYDNLCNIASTLGRHTEALDWAEKAGDGAYYNRAFALLHLGRWREAWADYDRSAGSASRPMTERDYELPRWDGKRPGKVIVHGEQGVGDEIMFMSMLPAEFDGVIDCNPRTATMFQRAFPNATVYGTLLQSVLEWPVDEKADWHLEMGGLGAHYAPEPFRKGAYLKADPADKAAWDAWIRAKVHSFPALGRPTRVGVAWTGGTWETGRKKRSVPFEVMRRYLFDQHRDVTWVNLEYEPRPQELELLDADGVTVLNPARATKKGADLDDLAGLVSSLDLVITATNSTVDLCGALGVPVWVMTDPEPQWRYSHAAGEDQMWFYESARLFRQKTGEGWDRVAANVALALAKAKQHRVAA